MPSHLLGFPAGEEKGQDEDAEHGVVPIFIPQTGEEDARFGVGGELLQSQMEELGYTP